MDKKILMNNILLGCALGWIIGVLIFSFDIITSSNNFIKENLLYKFFNYPFTSITPLFNITSWCQDIICIIFNFIFGIIFYTLVFVVLSAIVTEIINLLKKREKQFSGLTDTVKKIEKVKAPEKEKAEVILPEKKEKPKLSFTLFKKKEPKKSTQASNQKKITQVIELINKLQNLLNEGDLKNAKTTYKKTYNLCYKLPIKNQTSIMGSLEKIKKRIDDIELHTKKLAISELSDELNKLKNDSIYVIFNKEDVSKKLDSLTKYVKKVKKQNIHGLKAGKIHVKNKLKDLVASAEKTKKQKKSLNKKQKKFLSKIKDVGIAHINKEKNQDDTFKGRVLYKKSEKEKQKIEGFPIENSNTQVNVKRLKELAKEEEKIMSKFSKPIKGILRPTEKKEPQEEKKPKIKKVRKRKTNEMNKLSQEEKKLQKELNNLN